MQNQNLILLPAVINADATLYLLFFERWTPTMPCYQECSLTQLNTHHQASWCVYYDYILHILLKCC